MSIPEETPSSQPWEGLRPWFGLEVGWTATGMQPECPSPAPWDSHDAVGRPTSLGCLRSCWGDDAHGRSSRNEGGRESK
jgi:hypothetical protein